MGMLREKSKHTSIRLGTRPGPGPILHFLLPLPPRMGCRDIPKWGSCTGNGDRAARPCACCPAGIPKQCVLPHYHYRVLGQPTLHPHQRSELGRRLWVHLTHICPYQPPQFHQGGSRPIPSPAPGLAQMVGLEKMPAPEDSSRWECFLGTGPRRKGLVSWLLETDAPISLPTSC